MSLRAESKRTLLKDLMRNSYFVYILKCSDNTLYTGVTNNLERRIAEHQEGLNPSAYTHSRRPLKLLFQYELHDINEAIDFEKQIKGWSRNKKMALIKGAWELLPELSECKNKTSHKGFDSAQPDKHQ